MGFSKFLCFLSAILINLTVINAQSNSSLFHFCGTTGNYTNSSNSPYATNLNQLLSSLSSNATRSSNGFMNMTVGRDPDTAYGSFLCRGDVTTQSCQACVEEARKSITERCPNQKESIIWYDPCMLRYSNRSFFSIMENSQTFYMWNLQNTTDPEGLNRVLGDLMNSLATEAESSTSFFATKDVNFTSFQKIYGLVQCTPDLTRRDCDLCLRGSISQIPNCCNRRLGGRVVSPSCNIRYETYPFYESRAAPPPVSLQPPPPLTNSTKPEGKNLTLSYILKFKFGALDKSRIARES